MKKRIYQRMWFWIILALLVSGIGRWLLSEPADHDGNAPRSDVEYAEVTVDELFEEINTNPLRAEDKYNDQYVAVTGVLRVIDDDSIGLYPLGYESIDGVHCVLVYDDQREKLKEYSKGDTITVKGKIREVGDVFLYKMTIDCIE